MKKIKEIETEMKGIETLLNRPQCLSENGRNYWRSNLEMLAKLREYFHPINPESMTFQGAVDALKWYLGEDVTK